MMNSMAKKLLAIAAAVLLVTGLAYGMTINGQLVKAMFENLSSDPTGYLGRVYYNTTSNTVKIYNGTSWTEIGSGSSGSLASNLIDNGNAETASVPAAWTTFDDGAVSTPVDGTGGSPSAITAIARTTTAGELIDGTASFKLVKSAANAQGEGWAYDFTLKTKSQLYSQLVGLEFDFYSSSSSSDTVVVYVYDKDAATLITPQFVTCGSTTALTSQTTACHAQIAWLSTTSDDYRLIFMVSTTGASAHNYFIDNLYTGQIQSAVGAAVGGWNSVTTASLLNDTTNLNSAASNTYWRRVGDSMQVSGFIVMSGAGGATTATITIPNGNSIDTSKTRSTASTSGLGEWGWYDDSGAASGREGTVTYGSSTSVTLRINTTAAQLQLNSLANNDVVSFRFTAPIAQWAGANSVNFGNNNVEYVYNSGTWDATDSTSFAIGPTGGSITGALATTARTKRVRFSSTIDSTDAIVLQLSEDGIIWIPAASFGDAAGNFMMNSLSSTAGATTNAGVTVKKVSGSTTDLDIIFHRYASLANDDAPTTDWVNGWKWRVIKHKSGVPVGFGLASTTNAGLVNNQDTGSFTATFTQSGGYSQAVTVKYRRVNNIVTLNIPSFVGTTTANAVIAATSAIPAAIRPASLSIASAVIVRDNGATQVDPGWIYATSAGTIELDKSSTTTAFTSGASGGLLQAVSLTYNLD